MHKGGACDGTRGGSADADSHECFFAAATVTAGARLAVHHGCELTRCPSPSLCLCRSQFMCVLGCFMLALLIFGAWTLSNLGKEGVILSRAWISMSDQQKQQ